MLKLDDFSAVIFDMDGMVLDTESTYRIAWRKAARAMGHNFSEPFLRMFSGLQASDVGCALTEYGGTDFDVGEFNRLSASFWRSHVAVHGIEVKRGFGLLRDFLVQQNIPYCLATNSAAVNAHQCLNLAGLQDVFPLIIAREEVVRGKPAPDIFLKAAEELQVPINRCLVLEDSPTGIEAASRAGALSVFIPSAAPVNPETVKLCDQVFDDLTKLLDAMQT